MSILFSFLLGNDEIMEKMPRKFQIIRKDLNYDDILQPVKYFRLVKQEG
jgi:hypothetical protein